MIYDDKKFIGSVIRNARKLHGYNQAKLAEKLGMSEKNIGNIENGKQFPQVNNFLKIIEILNLSLNDFGVIYTEDTKEKEKTELISKILSCSKNTLHSYSKAINLVDDITENSKN